MPAPTPGQKVVVIPLFFKKQLQTDGTTNTSYLDLELERATEWGPYLASITAHTATENRTSNFTWRLIYWWSLDGRRWNGSYDLFSSVSSNADTVQTANATTTTFGLRMRYGIAVVNASGTAIERAVCSAVLAFTFQS